MDVREAAYTGDVDALRKFVEEFGTDINDQQPINQWTALHWAVKGGYARAVHYLCSHGADVNIKNKDGKRPIDMELTPEIAAIFGLTTIPEKEGNDPNLPHQTVSMQGTKPRAHWYSSEQIKPNLERHPSMENTGIPNSQFPEIGQSNYHFPASPVPMPLNSGDYGRLLTTELCLRAKIDQDEYWIEFPLRERSFSALQEILTQELGIDSKKQSIQYIIKVPNVLVRNDWDVSRLQFEQELLIRLAE